jgi:hypothetical protein
VELFAMDLTLLTVAVFLLLLLIGALLLTRRRRPGHLAYRVGPHHEPWTRRMRRPAGHREDRR